MAAAWSSSSNLVCVHFVSIVCVLSVIGNGFLLLDSVATVACSGSLMALIEVMAKEAAATEVNKDAAEC